MDARYRGQEAPAPVFVRDWMTPNVGPPKGRPVPGGFATPFKGTPGMSAQQIADSLTIAGFRKPNK